jgi:predicted nucleic acid-binding protein
MYLIDTVVLSELRKARRDAGLVAWFDGRRTSDLFVSVISIGEIERGVVQIRVADPEFATLLAT